MRLSTFSALRRDLEQYFQYKISKCFFCNMLLIYVVYINKKKNGTEM